MYILRAYGWLISSSHNSDCKIISQTNWNDGDTCDLRGNNKSVPDEHGFFLMNHWKNDENLDLPSRTNAEEFNTYEFLSTRFGKCKERLPNIVAVDFWSEYIVSVIELNFSTMPRLANKCITLNF